ncbi:ABC transporter permease subunit [Lactobacillus delbrueckii subsp. bulgaricus]
MALGVYITFRILDIADLTVDGTFATGGAVSAVLIMKGVNPWLAVLVSLVAGLLAGGTGFDLADGNSGQAESSSLG